MLPFAIVTLLSCLPASAPCADLAAFVERVVKPALEREGVPGISVAVLQEGEPLFARGFGWSDERLGLPMQVQSAFPLGALGRGLVAAAVLREVEREALKLDATLGELLPGTPPALQPIQLRQLLEGRSGLPAARELFEKLAAAPPAERLTRKEFLELLAALPAQGAPGESFAADSTAWLLYPLLVHEAGKRTLGECLEQEFCAPLGLRDTRVHDELAGAAGHSADCREVQDGCTLEVWSGVEPREACTHLFSTPSDLVRWQSALFRNELLSAPSTRLLTESARSRSGAPLGQNACFELGLLGGEARWRQVGGVANWRGALSWYEGARLSVCVLANCSSARVGELEEEIARYLLRLPPREPQDLPLENGESAALCGAYQLGTLRVRIFERDAQLWYESAAEPAFRLRSQGLRRFVSAGGEVLVRFSDEAARAQSFEETRRGSTSIARRMDS